MSLPRRRGWLLAVAVAASLGASAAASAGTIIAPSSAPTAGAQLFTLAVQPDPAKEGRKIPVSQIDLFVPAGFAVDSFEPTPGWEQDWTVQSVQKSTWTRDASDLHNEKERNEAAEHDAVFHFLGRPGSSRSYEFTVRQTYTDGTVVQWGPKVDWPGGPAQSAGPGPTVEGRSADPASGGTSTLAVVALVVAALGLVLGAAALVLARRR